MTDRDITKQKIQNLSEEAKLNIARKVLGDYYEEEIESIEDRDVIWSILKNLPVISEGCSLHIYHKEYCFEGETYRVYFAIGSNTPFSVTIVKPRDWNSISK